MLSKHENDLRELLNEKLRNHELPVSEHLWSGIQSKIPATSAPGVSMSLAKILLMASAVIAITAVVVLVSSGPSERGSTGNQDSRVQNSTPLLPADSVHETPNKSETTVQTNGKNRLIVPSNDHSVNSIHQGPSNLDAPSIGNPNTLDHVDPAEPLQTNQVSDSPKENITDKSNNVSQNKPNNFTSRFSAIRQDQEQLIYFFFPEYSEKCSVRWDFGDGNTATDMAISHVYEKEGVYNVRLSITDLNTNETLKQEQKIEAWLPVRFHLPNIFTPNGDGNNDELDASAGCSGCDVLSIVISDATGREIFRSSDGIWRGQDTSGNPVEEGTYVYSISIRDRSGKQEVRQGLIALKR